MQKATTSDLKQANKRNILRYIYEQGTVSNAGIAEKLRLSRPTVTQCVRELEAESLISRNGHLESTGGRKAAALRFAARSGIAVGVELLSGRFEMIALDLYGDVIRLETREIPFRHCDDYYNNVCREINRFIDALPVSRKRLLGVGVVLQGLISADGERVTYGKILGCTGLTIARFRDRLGCPCRFFHDAESAATMELWKNPGMVNAFFFNIRTNLSGAFIVNGRFLQGNNLKSGVFEHMTIVPEGKPCYCGKQGCVDAYCSYPVLLEQGERLEGFFTALREGDPQRQQLWADYLGRMAAAIDNLHMLIDYDIVLGGTLPRFLEQADLDTLHRMVADRSAFPTDRPFIRIARCAGAAISRGAALSLVQQHLARMM